MGCVLYCLVYTALGLCLSAFGPVILDLAAQTGGTLQATGYCLIIRSLGYLGGSFAGFLYDYFPGHRLLSLAMALAGVGTLGITVARSTAALAATVSLQGVAMGLIDTGANLLILWLFKDKAGPPLQSMHCAFAVGATLGPLLENAVEAASSGSGSGSGALVGVGAYNPAFYIIAAFCFLLCLLLLLVESPSARTTTPAAPDPAAPVPASEALATGSAAGAGAEEAATLPQAPAKAPAATRSLEWEKWRIILATATLLGTCACGRAAAWCS
jgi:sugar phosphate permease